MAEYNLIAACWTSAGACAPCTDDERSPTPIRERVEAVSHAGFTGFGIQHNDLLEVRDGIGFATLRRLFDDNGISTVEIEFLDDWMETGEARRVSDSWRALLLEAAEALNARHIKTGGKFHGSDFDAERLAPDFARLTQDAANVGAMVCVEPAPFREIRTPAQALELVNLVDHPAGGLILDIWHVERQNIGFDTIAALPANRVLAVELDDAASEVVGTLLEDTIDRRMFPGEGSFDVAGFVAAVKKTGYAGPWGVEMISAECRALPVREAARRAYQSSIAFVDPAPARHDRPAEER